MPVPESLRAALEALEKAGVGKAPLDAKGRTRARILRAATGLFEKQGYRRASIDEIAREAGVAKGTVYVHFKNKAELFFHAVAEEKKKFVGRFMPIFAADLPAEERFRRYLELGLRIIPEIPLVSKLIRGDRELLAFFEELDPQLDAQVRGMQMSGLGALLSGIGAWDRLDPREQQERMVVLHALFFSFGYLMEPRFRGGLDPERYTELLAKIIAHGAGAP